MPYNVYWLSVFADVICIASNDGVFNHWYIGTVLEDSTRGFINEIFMNVTTANEEAPTFQ